VTSFSTITEAASTSYSENQYQLELVTAACGGVEARGADFDL
jgi:hypothetical protein